MDTLTSANSAEEAHRAAITKKGYTFQRVAQDPVADLHRNYTIGLAESFGWPELVMLGTLDQQSANNILSIVIYKWQDNQQATTADITPTPGQPFRLRLKQLTKEAGIAATKLVSRFKGDDNYMVVQVIWSDAEGNFPGEPDYNPSPLMAQPLLEQEI